MIVRAEGLTKSFPVQRGWGEALRAPFARRSHRAIDQVSFEVAEGEIFGLLGQNGAGKTTLFKMLATLLVADAGTASVAGSDVARDPAGARNALAPILANERSLYWRLSATENLRLYSALQGLAGAAARREEARLLGITGLTEAGTKPVGAFSTGMRQRLLIARALLAKPRVLLLDEPTRSLDPISARDFRAFLRDTLVRAEGCTVLLATHDADEVWELCDRVGVLERGRLLALDATAVLRHRAGSDRYRVWVHEGDRALLEGQARSRGYALTNNGAAAESGWREHETSIPEGTEGAARFLSALTGAGARIARFERVAPSLADLIERVVTGARGGPDA